VSQPADPRSAPSPLAAPRPEPPRGLDALQRAGGAVVSVWGGAVLALWGAFLTPFRVGTLLVPVSLVLAVVGNAALMLFAYRTTRHRLLGLLPGLAWMAVSVVAADRTAEGDVVLRDNWVSLAYLLAGSATIAIVGYRLAASPTPTSRRS